MVHRNELAPFLRWRYFTSPVSISPSQQKGVSEPLVQRHGSRHNGDSNATDYPPQDHHRECAAAPAACLRNRSDAEDGGTDHGGIAAPEGVTERPRDEDVAEPCADIVNAGYDTLLLRGGVVLDGDPAGVDEDGRENADVVA